MRIMYIEYSSGDKTSFLFEHWLNRKAINSVRSLMVFQCFIHREIEFVQGTFFICPTTTSETESSILCFEISEEAEEVERVEEEKEAEEDEEDEEKFKGE